MMKIIIITLLLLSCSCGRESKHHAATHDNAFTELQKIRDQIKAGIPAYQDKFGFIHSDRCDSALYSGLISAGGADVEITAAMDADGKCYRTPFHDCYINEQNNAEHTRRSKSCISREMILAIMWALVVKGDQDSLTAIYEYGKAHKWVMGEGPIDRTLFTPNARETLYIVLGKAFEGLDFGWTHLLKDFDRHAVAINIALRGHVQGYINGDMLDTVRKFAEDDPENTLFQFIIARYTHGDQSHTIELALSQAREFPPGERCVKWLWERHSSKWRNCESTEMATGGEILFLVMLLEHAREKGSDQSLTAQVGAVILDNLSLQNGGR